MKFLKSSFQNKLYISCFLLNLIFLCICSTAFYYYTASSLKRNMEDSLVNNTFLLMKDLDTLLDTGDNTLKDLQTNSEFFSEAKKITPSSENYFTKHIPVRSALQNTFRSALFSHKANGSINYVSKYYDNIGTSSVNGAVSYLDKEKLLENGELNRFMDEIVYITYAPPHQDYWGDGKTVFSVIRSMRDAYRQYGLLIFDFDISALTDLMNSFENPEDYSITLLDTDQKLVYTSSADLDRTKFYDSYRNAVQTKTSGTFSHNTTSLSCFEVSSVTGWTFILTSSAKQYLSSTKQLLTLCVFLFFSLFITMSCFLYFITNRLTTPLKQLTGQLRTLEPGGNITLSHISGDDEISLLTNTIQSFLTKIYDQNLLLTEANHRTLQAHYDAMEAQLNPHFLYNTLSVIGMAGLSEGNTTVATMCTELANLLRYSLSYSGQSVSLKQEITNAESYLYIMKMRYEDDLMYEWDLTPDLDELPVPKLILQPLLENCFQHGFHRPGQEVIPPWKIKISSFQDDSYWYLAVTDNGAPFSKEKQHQLKQRLQSFKLSHSREELSENIIPRQGFGLENTILRLHIYYYGDAYFQIDTSETGWTTVTIGGPLKPQNFFTRN